MAGYTKALSQVSEQAAADEARMRSCTGAIVYAWLPAGLGVLVSLSDTEFRVDPHLELGEALFPALTSNDECVCRRSDATGTHSPVCRAIRT